MCIRDSRFLDAPVVYHAGVARKQDIVDTVRDHSRTGCDRALGLQNSRLQRGLGHPEFPIDVHPAPKMFLQPVPIPAKFQCVAPVPETIEPARYRVCLLYTSDAADERSS